MFLTKTNSKNCECQQFKMEHKYVFNNMELEQAHAHAQALPA